MASSLTSREYAPYELKEEFLRVYGEGDGVRILSSPARINIIGEHIDYNGGKV
ncbi:MAG: galactokinase family protein, partial [Treponema sp.]|nr:galactokinase family protein [Treponema sp.]